jgi:hypothetical protein
MPFPSEISYTAFLQYSPRGISKTSVSSRAVTGAIKNDTFIQFIKDGKPVSVRGIEYVVSLISREMENYPFLRECLGPEFALVPIPRSAPLRIKDALWPSRRICEALVAAGLGAEVLPLLNRRTAVQKAATADKGMRPEPEQHYESTVIDNNVPSLLERPITLVDDVITRGSSFVGMFRRITEAFPKRKISCFALVRTESEGEIVTLKSPVQGTITRYPSGKLWRSSGSAQQSNLL